MPRLECIIFTAKHLHPDKIQNKRIIDIGSCDFNGSIRPLLESYSPSEYLGIDMIEGPAVDRIINADELVSAYGENSFDVVVCLETIEHSRYWKKTISNIKQILKPGGYLALTAPAPGYPYHGHPTDFWRYTPDDFRSIFQDFEIINVESDFKGPGTFLFAKKPSDGFQEKKLDQYALYSILTGNRIVDLTPGDYKSFYYYKLLFKYAIKWLAYSIFHGTGRIISFILGLSPKNALKDNSAS